MSAAGECLREEQGKPHCQRGAEKSGGIPEGQVTHHSGSLRRKLEILLTWDIYFNLEPINVFFQYPLPATTREKRGERLGINALIREKERVFKMCPRGLKPLSGDR